MPDIFQFQAQHFCTVTLHIPTLKSFIPYQQILTLSQQWVQGTASGIFYRSDVLHVMQHQLTNLLAPWNKTTAQENPGNSMPCWCYYLLQDKTRCRKKKALQIVYEGFLHARHPSCCPSYSVNALNHLILTGQCSLNFLSSTTNHKQSGLQNRKDSHVSVFYMWILCCSLFQVYFTV